jgi:hypothetical protein
MVWRGIPAWLIGAISIAAIACPTSTFANDTMAGFAVGGLVFETSGDIEMRSEDLFVSADEIRVRYRFYNRADRPVTGTVAFPLPDITATPESNINIPSIDPQNPFAFRTLVNGLPVQAKLEQRVFNGEVEHTDLLRTLGIPFAPYLSETIVAINRLADEGKAQLVELGLAFEYDRDLYGGWTVRTNYHWQQTFPARSETIVEHRYKPGYGSKQASATSQLSESIQKDLDSSWFDARKYCADASFTRGLVRMAEEARQRDRYAAILYSNEITYVLTTGANWAAPIGDFRLVVDKGDPLNLVSFCGEGIRKISATQFEMRKANFRPSGDLHVVIVSAR